MSRWRPPPEKSTALVTRAGHDRLKAELDQLWRVQRPEVVRALAAAAAEGDRSENAEYTYRKKQLAGIDRRVRYLGKRLPALKVVEQAPSDPDAVYFGAWVELERIDNGELARYLSLIHISRHSRSHCRRPGGAPAAPCPRRRCSRPATSPRRCSVAAGAR